MPVLRRIAGAYLAAVSIVLAALPIAAISYLLMSHDDMPHFVTHHGHVGSIGMVSVISALLTMIAFGSYLESGERLTRCLTLGFLGFTVSYSLHGLFTPLANTMPALFLLPGPTSRLLMAICVLAGVLGHGAPIEPPQFRRSNKAWLPSLLRMGALLAFVLWAAVVQPQWGGNIRLGLEAGAAFLSAAVLVALPLRRVRGPILWYHAIGLCWMTQASVAFLLASPWNHLWWLAHIVSLGGFLLLGYGLAQAHLANTSFSGLHSTSQAYADIADMKRTQALLRQAIDQAELANQTKSRFLASASHDLRQPVQSLMLFTSLLENYPLEEKPKSVLRNIGNAVQALKGLLDGLLDISRLDAGVIEAHASDFDVRPVLSALSDEYTLTATRKGLTLGVASETVWLKTDPALLERILRNLLDNAIKYTQKGGIAIECRRQGNAARIEVRDTGIGIPEDQHSMVFDEFHQLDNPERDRGKGLGLGLAIVRRLTDLLGLTLVMTSQVGRGTSFVLTVPLGVVTADASDTPPVSRPFKGLVLLIEDDHDVQAGLTMVLEHWGWQVVSGATPDAVWADMPPGGRPSVVLSDYSLGDGLNGIHALEILENKLGYRPPALLLTRDTAPERMAEALQSGISVLHKPIRPDELKSAMRSLVTDSNTGG